MKTLSIFSFVKSACLLGAFSLHGAWATTDKPADHTATDEVHAAASVDGKKNHGDMKACTAECNKERKEMKARHDTKWTELKTKKPTMTPEDYKKAKEALKEECKKETDEIKRKHKEKKAAWKKGCEKSACGNNTNKEKHDDHMMGNKDAKESHTAKAPKTAA